MRDKPTPRDELKELLEPNVKGGDVELFGPGLTFVTTSDRPVETGPSWLFNEHNWYVGGIVANHDEEETAVFIYPNAGYAEEQELQWSDH